MDRLLVVFERVYPGAMWISLLSIIMGWNDEDNRVVVRFMCDNIEWDDKHTVIDIGDPCLFEKIDSILNL